MIDLQKGQRIGLGLQNICVGLGWKPSTKPGVEFDLDASAFMIGANGKLPQDEFFVFYNNQTSIDGSVASSGDDQTGGNSDDGDDETLTINLSKVDQRVEEIIIVVTIHEAEARKQNFGQVRDSYLRIYNADNNEVIARFDLEEDYSACTAIECGRFYRKNGEWKFEGLGDGMRGGLQALVDKYA